MHTCFGTPLVIVVGLSSIICFIHVLYNMLFLLIITIILLINSVREEKEPRDHRTF